MASKYSIDAVFRAIDRFTGPINRMQRSQKRFTTGMQIGLKSVTSAFRLTSQAVGVASVAVGALALKAGMVGASFETAMSGVGAVMLKSTSEIRELEARAQQLGKTTKFTATEVASGMELMARAGFKEKDILSGIEGVLNAAAASGMELAETSSHVSNVLKGMGLATSEAGRVADVLALASSRTNSTIGSLGESMKNVAATARQLNIPLESTVAAVALLQDVGLDASEAGSSLNRMLVALSKLPPKTAASFKKLGIAFQDEGGKALSFDQIMANVGVAVKAAGGNMKQIAMIADAVGMRGQKAALNLQEMAQTGKLKELTEALEGALGTSEKMADLKLDNLSGDFTLFKSALDGVSTRLYKMEGGPLRGVVQRTTEWLGANEDLIATNVAEWAGDLRQNLPPIVSAMGKIIGYTWKFIKFAKDSPVTAAAAIVAGRAAIEVGTMVMRNAIGKMYGDRLAVVTGGKMGAATAATLAAEAPAVGARIGTAATATMTGQAAAVGAKVGASAGASTAAVAAKSSAWATAGKAIGIAAGAAIAYRIGKEAIDAAIKARGIMEGKSYGVAAKAAAATGEGKSVERKKAALKEVEQAIAARRKEGVGFVESVVGAFTGNNAAQRYANEIRAMTEEAAKLSAELNDPMAKFKGMVRELNDMRQNYGTRVDEAGNVIAGGPRGEHGSGYGIRAGAPEPLPPQQIEIKITGDTDSVDVPKKPKAGGNVKLRLQPSGAL